MRAVILVRSHAEIEDQSPEEVKRVKAAVHRKFKNRCDVCGITNEEHLRKRGSRLAVHRKVPGSRYTVKGCQLLCATHHPFRECFDRHAARVEAEKLEEERAEFAHVTIDDETHPQLKRLQRRFRCRPAEVLDRAVLYCHRGMFGRRPVKPSAKPGAAKRATGSQRPKAL